MKQKLLLSGNTQLMRLARKERLDYNDFLYVCQQAHKKLGLRKTKRERKLPQLLTEAELKRTPFEHISKCWQKEQERFKLNPHHHNMGLNT